MIWLWLILGFLIGILTAKIWILISDNRKIRQIEKKRLHWIFTDKIKRVEEKFTMPDGTELQGYIYQSDWTPAVAPTILFLHGLGGYAQDFNFEPMLSSLCLAGYRVFAYDFRASGSSRKPNEPDIFSSLSPSFLNQIFHDPIDAITWVLSHASVDKARFAVMGGSLGAAMALSSVLHDPRVKLIIGICSPFDLGENLDKNLIHGPFINRLTFRILGRNLFNKRIGDRPMIDAISETLHQVSPSASIQLTYNYKNRVFLAHCKNDEILPYHLNFPQLIEKMRLPNTQTIVFEYGGHEFKGQESALMSQVAYWLNKNL